MSSKQNIIFDVDGVILDYMSSFLDYVNQKYDTTYTFNDANKYDFSTYLPSNVNAEKIYNEYLKTDYISNLKYFKNVKTAVNKLSEHYNIIIMTAISENVKKERLYNIRDINYSEIHFIRDKHLYLKKYNPVCVFEDAPFHIKDYIKVRKQFKLDTEIYVPARPWNINAIQNPDEVIFYTDETIMDIVENLNYG